MRSFTWIGLGALLVACGGSVDGGKTGSGGSSGAGGSVATGGTSGSSGTSGGGGTVASGGSAGVGGASGGSGGVPACCTGDGPCSYSGAGGGAGAYPPMECVANSCKPVPTYPKCWTSKDCPTGLCEGALPCPCGSQCKTDQMGTCMQPPDPGCCQNDADCAMVNDPPGEVCVQGRCLPPISDGCWSDSQCPAGQSCVGVGVCPCNVVCGIADTPGKCQ